MVSDKERTTFVDFFERGCGTRSAKREERTNETGQRALRFDRLEHPPQTLPVQEPRAQVVERQRWFPRSPPLSLHHLSRPAPPVRPRPRSVFVGGQERVLCGVSFLQFRWNSEARKAFGDSSSKPGSKRKSSLLSFRRTLQTKFQSVRRLWRIRWYRAALRGFFLCEGRELKER